MPKAIVIYILLFVLFPFFTVISTRYQINARTELAVRYNDISPLENHHCAVCFEILAEVNRVFYIIDEAN